ncbi:putative cell wall-binding protein [Cryobacterium sp. MP_M3]|uniref:cell wall-binding repeat-containing protein n=2 Tax=unclassified Cryobacterium TaxID=2649013 RepID=UPI0018C9AD84|nr:cell wall-binding repeat-containing protein [Cryobacterium sp. MP_M3]MBG6058532.1 putative cell wall-binding protein [Cryobacterium sp. MP_M3]
MQRRWTRPNGSVLLATVLMVAMLHPGPAAAASGSSPLTGLDPPATDLLNDDMVSPADILGSPRTPQLRQPQNQPDLPAAGLAQSSHVVDVAVIVPSGSTGWTAPEDDARVRALVTQTGDYWKQQSNNQVVSVTAGATIKRYASAFTCAQQQQAWTEAGQAFGHPDGVQSYVSAASRHLLVLVPADCGGTGLGSVGSAAAPVSGANGGAIWASVGGVNDLDIIAHEFGHNLGLGHSNSHYCPDAAVPEGNVDPGTGSYSDGCADHAYGDYYDIMGAAWSVNYNGTLIANARPTALNITHKSLLGAVGDGEMQVIPPPVGAAAQHIDVTMASAGSPSGLRALRMVDPVTGQTYFVDFRGGGGMDSQSLYESGLLASYGTAPGVRVLTLRGNGSSVVLLSPDATTHDGHKEYLTAGQSLSTRSGGLRVKVNSVVGGAASVSVTLSPTMPVTRVAGVDRFATSAAVSAASFAPGASVVYVASGMNFPDALSAAPVAGAAGAPVLLVSPTEVPASIAAELVRLRPGRIVVLGSESAIGAGVVVALRGYTAGTVSRVAGVDRFATSAAVSAASFAPGASVVYVASGMNFPDALSAAPVAGAAGAPVLLVSPTEVPASIAAELVRLRPGRIVVLGSESAIGAGVVVALRGYTAGTVSRVAGVDRFATSAAVSAASFAPGASVVYVASGMNFPDALSAAPVAGAAGAPVLLVSPTEVPASIAAELVRLRPGRIVVLGSESAIGAGVAQQLLSFIP